MISITLFALLAFSGIQSPVSKSDAVLLNRVHHALDEPRDDKSWFIEFERSVKPADAVRAQSIVSHLKPNSRSYAELSFVQAYYGVDLPNSLDRIQRPYNLWKRNVKTWEREYHFRDYDEFNILSNAGGAFCLNLLYLKCHDPKILGRWLDLKLDGHDAEDNSTEIADFWERHAREMLQVACLKPSRLNNLAENICFERLGNMENAAGMVKERQRLFAGIAPFTHDKNAKIAQTALALEQAILKIEVKYRKLHLPFLRGS